MIWCVGDSMTVGQGTSRSWARRWADRLAGQTAGEALVHVHAVGGDTVWPGGMSTWLPEQIEAAQERPDRIVAMIGANSVHSTQDADIDTLLQAWEGFHERIEQDYDIPMYWLTVPPFRAGTVYPGAWIPLLAPRRTRINTWMRAAMGGRARLYDVVRPLEDGSGLLRPEMDSGDGLHIGTLAHVVIADALPLLVP